MEKIKGSVWKFGDNIDTDVLAPFQAMNLPWEERKSRILHTRKGFTDQVRPGDIIVAGKNWGCGSSREQAAENIKNLGISAVVAESFGRIFYRNAVALALPAITCPGVLSSFDEGDILELDLHGSIVRNLSREVTLDTVAYTPDMINMIEMGGMLNSLKQKLAEP